MYQRRLFPLFMIPLLLFSLSACVTDPMSWSPDGRYLTFIGMNDQRLWLWDSHSDESRMLVDAQIVGCRFLPNNHEIIYGVEDDKEANLFKFDIQSGQSTLLMEKVSYYFDLSPDGNDLFYMKANSSQNSTDLYRYDLSLNQETLLLSLDGTAIQCIDVDPSGKRFLLTLDEHTLALWEAGQKDIQTLGTKSDRNLLFPQWFDDDHYLYFDTDGAHDIGNLIFDSITNPSPVILCEEVLIWDLPSFSSDRKSLYVTQQVDQNLNQIVQIDLATHEKKVMIQNPLGAGWATLHPSKNQVAYISETFDDNSSSLLHIQDMKTEHDHIVWRDEEESKVATAESLRQSGEYPLAIRIYQDILAQYPNSRFTNLAWFKMLQMYLAPPFVNIDQAFEALNQMSQPSPQAQSMFWKETDRSATDPAEDWIARYCTAEAQTQYEFNTDLTRDLLGLSVKLSDRHLFMKIDYNSNRDLSGLSFQDTIILLDYNSPQDGVRKISDLSQWDRGAERILVLRHWYQNGFESQYDVSILDEKGEIIAHFLASGFAPSNFPIMNLIQIPQGETGSIVLSIDRDTLGLENRDKMEIQVCTLKGGIESFLHKEQPTTVVLDGKPACDIADTFGEDNTADRIMNDARAGKPTLIYGYAAEIDIEK